MEVHDHEKVLGNHFINLMHSIADGMRKESRD